MRKDGSTRPVFSKYKFSHSFKTLLSNIGCAQDQCVGQPFISRTRTRRLAVFSEKISDLVSLSLPSFSSELRQASRVLEIALNGTDKY